MIAILSRTVSDASMPVVLELSDPGLYTGARRLSVTKTLDQGASFSDQGFSVADRQYQLRSIISEDDAAILRSLLENNNELTLSVWDGLFKVAPIRFQVKGNGKAVFLFAIKEQLSS
ncbi:MAG: hypothetical protein B6244_14475 [Candidatus Cloacimonetes bacterium 4572_55]|nr:MAG: hypothetical protein B6244_14475 [Candidatus Cloacimonetes bacterium 4572_55]